MLKNEVDEVDLYQVYETIWPLVKAELDSGLVDDAEEISSAEARLKLDYPALRYPSKITSFNLDKQALVEGKLEAIKGQYLILDNGVINIRKYGGYLVNMECD